jgi:hypothetical protein
MKNPWKLSTLALTVMLGVVVGTPRLMNTASADAQPKMKAALLLLKDAQSQLEDASHDKGGHRAAALKAVKVAIEEVELGIKVDNAR